MYHWVINENTGERWHVDASSASKALKKVKEKTKPKRRYHYKVVSRVIPGIFAKQSFG